MRDWYGHLPAWYVGFDDATGFTSAVLCAVLFGCLALVLPFRRQQGRIELGWDLAAFGVTILVTFLYLGPFESLLLERIDQRIGGRLDAYHSGYDWLPTPALVLLWLLVADLLYYCAHRFLHSSLLWHAHAFHHKPEHINPLSGVRASPLHVVVLAVSGTTAYLLLPYPEAGLAVLAHSVLSACVPFYAHANLRVPFASYLEYVFVTPRFHFVHHSRDRRYSDTNFGEVLTIWDRIFGTFDNPDTVPLDEPTGLNYELSNLRAMLGLPPTRTDNAPSRDRAPAS